MQLQRHEQINFTVASVLFLTTLLINLLSKGINFEASPGAEGDQPLSYSHNANTYPRTWQIGPLESVHMSYENSRHYSIDDPIGELEWNSTLPTGGAVIYLGPQRTPFTVSLFHQLRCLNIVRAGIVNHHSTNNNIHNDSMQDWALITHCMNYLRQMILCHMDVTMESVRTTVGRGITVWDITHTCKDWSVVYQAAERNYRG